MAKRRAKPHARVKEERRVLSPDAKWAESLIAKMRAACHAWQLDAVDDPHRRISLLVGRGGGKTTALRVRGVQKCLRKRKARVLYFAKTRLRAKDLMWYALKDLCDNLGLVAGRDVVFNETELRMTIVRTGSVYQLSGAKDLGEIEKWRGETFDEVQIDEGATHTVELLDVLMYRVIGPRLRKGCIILVGTPGHILAGTFYDVTRPGSEKHRPYGDRETSEARPWSSHWWTLEMVVALAGAQKKYPELWDLWQEALIEFRENQWGPDNPIRKREYGAVWAADDTTTIFQYRPRLEDGTPWNEWDPELVQMGDVKIAKLPAGPDGEPITDWLYALAMDHGSKDPFALNVFAASPSDPTRSIYHVYGFEQPKMFARRIAVLLLGRLVETNLDAAHEKPGGLIGAIGWPTGMVSDIKQLGQNILDELSQVYGIKVLPADQQGKFAGIELVNSDLVDGRFKILKGSTLAAQLAELQWKRDEYGFPQENKAQANHATDTLIYGRRLLAHLFENASDAPQKAKPKRDVFADPMGLDAGRDPDVPRGEFDMLFDDAFGGLDFGG